MLRLVWHGYGVWRRFWGRKSEPGLRGLKDEWDFVDGCWGCRVGLKGVTGAWGWSSGGLLFVARRDVIVG